MTTDAYKVRPRSGALPDLALSRRLGSLLGLCKVYLRCSNLFGRRIVDCGRYVGVPGFLTSVSIVMIEWIHVKALSLQTSGRSAERLATRGYCAPEGG